MTTTKTDEVRELLEHYGTYEHENDAGACEVDSKILRIVSELEADANVLSVLDLRIKSKHKDELLSRASSILKTAEYHMKVSDKLLVDQWLFDYDKMNGGEK